MAAAILPAFFLLLAAPLLALATGSGRTVLEPDQGVAGTDFASLEWAIADIQSRTDTVSLSLIAHLAHAPAQLAKLEERFWSVSDPDHADYGAHLTQREVTDIVARPAREIESVTEWLAAGGATGLRVGAHRDSIRFEMSARDAEALFRTEIRAFRHRARAGVVVHRATAPYSVPDAIAPSLALVSGLLRLPDLDRFGVQAFDGFDGPEPEPAAKGPAAAGWPNDCPQCSQQVTPAVLAARYALPAPTASDPPATLAVSEFQGQVWDQHDLDDFAKNCKASVPFNISVAHENGTIAPGNACKIPIIGSTSCGECLLDIEYAKSTAGPAIPLTDIYSPGYNLLDWSTTVEDIDDANIIGVHSVSYGNDEAQQTGVAFMDACNAAFMKIGVRGVSILFASGDQGVCGRSGCGFGKHIKPVEFLQSTSPE